MTTPADPIPDSSVTAPKSSRSRAGLVAALILPIGPVAIAVLRFLLPYSTVDGPGAMAAKVANHLGAQYLVVWLGLVAALTIVPAVIWIGRVTRPSAPVLTGIALILAVPGYLAMAVILSTDIVLWSGIRSGLDPAVVSQVVASAHPAVGVAEGIFVIGHLFGTLLLGMALWRSKAVPRWAAGMTVISQPLHLVAAVFLVNPSMDLVAWLMTAVGFGAAGYAIDKVKGREGFVLGRPSGMDFASLSSRA